MVTCSPLYASLDDPRAKANCCSTVVNVSSAVASVDETVWLCTSPKKISGAMVVRISARSLSCSEWQEACRITRAMIKSILFNAHTCQSLPEILVNYYSDCRAEINLSQTLTVNSSNALYPEDRIFYELASPNLQERTLFVINALLSSESA